MCLKKIIDRKCDYKIMNTISNKMIQKIFIPKQPKLHLNKMLARPINSKTSHKLNETQSVYTYKDSKIPQTSAARGAHFLESTTFC